MKYSHYDPNTGERGNRTRFSTYELTQADFEKITGRLVKDFTRRDYKPLNETTYDITLHTGEKFLLQNGRGSGAGSVFHAESGKVCQAPPMLAECAPDEDKLFRVEITVQPDKGKNTITPFFKEDHALALVTEIATGHGAFFKDDQGQLTVIPNHNISKAVLIESPYGG